ncbi:MAG: hypothetical protein ACYTBJ_24825 [Planctomycetota bacterium]|jgi:hypothetical protein
MRQDSYVVADRASRKLGHRYQNESWYRGNTVKCSEKLGWYIVLRSSGKHRDVPSTFRKCAVVVEKVGQVYARGER